MKLAESFRARSNFFKNFAPKIFNIDTDLDFWPQQPEFFFSQFEKTKFFYHKIPPKCYTVHTENSFHKGY